ncbi:MAG: SHOCT domain-containing protein [Phycisphaerales bacterium]|nr:SHOCT domain-containing protein [Phycisphaerales bacterium]
MPESAVLLGLVAQQAASARRPDVGPVLLWLAVLLGLVLAAGLAVLYLRTRLLGKDAGPGAGGLTLGELRKLRDAGRITEEEFGRARDAVIGGASAGVPRSDASVLRGGALRAPRGVDLTGEPLPRPPAEPGPGSAPG